MQKSDEKQWSYTHSHAGFRKIENWEDGGHCSAWTVVRPPQGCTKILRVPVQGRYRPYGMAVSCISTVCPYSPPMYTGPRIIHCVVGDQYGRDGCGRERWWPQPSNTCSISTLRGFFTSIYFPPSYYLKALWYSLPSLDKKSISYNPSGDIVWAGTKNSKG